VRIPPTPCRRGFILKPFFYKTPNIAVKTAPTNPLKPHYLHAPVGAQPPTPCRRGFILEPFFDKTPNIAVKTAPTNPLKPHYLHTPVDAHTTDSL